MKKFFRILGVGAAAALVAPMVALAQQEPLLGVDFTYIGVATGNGSVISANVTTGGSGYINPPTVTFSGGGAPDNGKAEAVATVSNGAVTGIIITKGGTGYTSLPTITIAPPGVRATATATLNGAGGIGSIAVNAVGSGYTTAPAVTITGGGGSGATVTAIVENGAVTGFDITNPGTGFASAPTLTIAAPGTTATATVRNLGNLFVYPFENEAYGPVGTYFTMEALAYGTFPAGGFTYEFFVNGAPLGTSTVVQPPGGGPGRVSWAPPQPGSYLLTVKASDGAHTVTSLARRYHAYGTAIVGPVEGTLVPNGSSVVVQATSTPPPSGQTAFVERVEFFVDGTLRETDRTYPYSFVYTPEPSPIEHVIEARGYDNFGNLIGQVGTATRKVKMVNAIGIPPQVRLVNPPGDGNIQAGVDLEIVADAVAPNGFIKNVDFYINGVLHSSSQTFPFKATIWRPLVPGRYQVVAIGYDDKSNAVASAPVVLTATGNFPSAAIVQPAASGLTVVQGSIVPVTVNAAGPDGGISSLKSVEFLVNGVVNDSLPKAPAGEVTTPPVLAEPFVFNWKSNVPVGTHRLAARVTGVNGLTVTSADVTVNVVANQAPTVAITTPSDPASATVGVATTVAAATADTDGTVASVDFFLNSTKIGSANKAPYQIEWTPATAGTFVLTAKSIDHGGAVGTSAEVAITVDPAAPSGPAQGAVTATVYRGDYGAAGESGRFAFALNRNNRGTLIAYSIAPTGKTYLWTDIAINPDGTFQVRDANNQVELSGQTSATGISGNFGGKTFIGPITPANGTFSPLLLTGTVNGASGSQVIAIVGGDSTVTLHTASGSNRVVGGGFLGTSGAFSFDAPGGGRLTGNVTTPSNVVSGSVSGPVSGSFQLRQQSSRISNISTRALAGSGERTLVAGFVVSGTGSKPLLVRAVGPTLTNFGVANPLPDPSLNVLTRLSAVVASNNDWSNSAALAALSAQVGAFALAANSPDAALQTSVTPGTYTAVVGGSGSASGSALIEIYDADLGSSVTSRITNISTRAEVGAGEALIAGFVISGDLRKKVLIRAVGPTLTSFGLSNVLADPKIEVLSGTTVVTTNNDWTEASTVAQVGAVSPVVGAFPLNANSKDAAVVLQLTPGSYTVQITGAANTSGTVLVEIYDADL